MVTPTTTTKPKFQSHSLGKGILKDENKVSFKPSPDMVLKHNMSMLNKAYSSESLTSLPLSDSTTLSLSSVRNGLRQHEIIIGNGYLLCETYEFEDFDHKWSVKWDGQSDVLNVYVICYVNVLKSVNSTGCDEDFFSSVK